MIERIRLAFSYELFFFLLLPVLLNSCATLQDGIHKTVKVDSEPQGAKVYVGDEYRGRTPLYLVLDKKWKGKRIEVRYRGYGSRSFRLDADLKLAVLWNAFFPLGAGVDLLTGGAIKYPNRYLKVDFGDPPDSSSKGQKYEFYRTPIKEEHKSGGKDGSLIRQERLPASEIEAGDSTFIGLAYPLQGVFWRELGAFLKYRPFPKSGFEFGFSWQFRAPYLVSNGASGPRFANRPGRGYLVRVGYAHYPMGGLAYRRKKMPHWGIDLIWKEFRSGPYCRLEGGSNGVSQVLRETVLDRVQQLKLLFSKGNTWSWAFDGNELGFFLETRMGVGFGMNVIHRKKMSWGYGGTCSSNRYPAGKEDLIGYPFPTATLDLRLGISTLFPKEQEALSRFR
ncbi:MAG: PEGA domain-containing protein [Flavobacteriales bacterium]